MTVMQKSKGIDNFFNSMFGFLYRKTDYFADQQNAFQFVDSNYKKWLKKFEDRKEKDAKKKKRDEDEKIKNAPVNKTGSVREITPEEYERRQQEEKLKQQKSEESHAISTNTSSKTNITTSSDNKEEEKEEDKLAEGKVKPGVGNGGSAEHYTWTQQDIKEIGISIPVPFSTRGKDLTIKHDAKTLLVQIKGQEPIINGEFHALIKPDSLVWTLEEVRDAKLITISFEKFDAMKWWECALKGDQEIDTRKINPEASKISDIEDPEMKAQIEKMMFDTRQKQMGLPSSDDLSKNAMMGNFMKAHPEMDFSKAKFN
jgi:hypothetical protein